MSQDSFGVRFTRSWVAFYTRGLPDVVGERRRAELESDLWEQSKETSSGRASAQVLDRCLRGIPADVWWRYRTLLEKREVRQRNRNMTRSILTNWWGVITAVLGVAVLIEAVAGIIWGNGGGVAWSAVTLLSGGLILGGLALLQRRVIAGSWMILVGALVPVSGIFTIPVAGIFMIPITALIVIGGLWTGHLQLWGTVVEEPHLQPARPQPADLTSRWYLWLVAASILFVIGFGALVVLGDGQTATGEDDTSLISSLAYLAWILSWFAAVISAGIGVVFGARRVIARHRTRPA